MKYLFMPVAAALLSVQALACDVCGGASGSYLGVLPRYNSHFIGLSMQYQQFTSIHPVMAGETEPVHSENYLRSLTAWGRFYPLKRLQVFGFVPYVLNSSTEPAQRVLMQGLGDMRLLANYMIVNTADSETKSLRHTLLAGGGMKAPTGRNDIANTEGIILSNMQPGTGSWDIIANANYTIRMGKTGINVDASYVYCTANSRDYRYGNRTNVAFTGFYWLEAGRLSILPQAGLKYEQSRTDHSSYYYRIRNTYSGGYYVYASAGATIYIGNLAAGVSMAIPAWQKYAGGLVTGKTRCELQLQYLFKEKNRTEKQ